MLSDTFVLDTFCRLALISYTFEIKYSEKFLDVRNCNIPDDLGAKCL